MNNNFNNSRTETFNTVLRYVFMWMASGLLLTGLTAAAVAFNPSVAAYVWSNPLIFTVLMIAQFGLVIGLSAGLRRMSFVTALGMFILYSVLNGIMLSSVFLVYTHGSIALTFGICAVMFALLSLYGYSTKSDLSAAGSIGFMLLIGLVISMLANFFFQSSAFDFIISIVGVFTFVLLTAYDVQRIKVLSNQLLVTDQETISKISIIGALMLYLDFVNLFLYLLRLLGNRKR